MGKNDKISSRELFLLAFLSILSPIVRILPSASVAMAGSAAWLCAVPAFAMSVVFIFVIIRLTKDAKNKDLCAIFEQSLGKTAGGILCVLIAVWLCFYAGFVTRAASERLLSAVFKSGSTPVFIAVMLALAAIGAAGSTRALTRAAEAFVPVIIAVLAFVIVSSVKNIEVKYLFPVTFRDTKAVIFGAMPIFEISALTVYFLFLGGHVRDAENLRRRWIFSVALALFVAFGGMVVALGSFSAELALKFQNAALMVVRNISVLHIAERVEALIISVWIVTDFAFLASLSMISAEILLSVFRARSRKPFAIAFCGVASVISYVMVSDAFQLSAFSDFIVPAVNLLITAVLIPTVLFIGFLREKFRGIRAKKRQKIE